MYQTLRKSFLCPTRPYVQDIALKVFKSGVLLEEAYRVKSTTKSKCQGGNKKRADQCKAQWVQHAKETYIKIAYQHKVPRVTSSNKKKEIKSQEINEASNTTSQRRPHASLGMRHASQGR